MSRKGRKAAPAIYAAKLKTWGRCGPFATQGRSYKAHHRAQDPRKHKGDPKVAFVIHNDKNRYFFLRTYRTRL